MNAGTLKKLGFKKAADTLDKVQKLERKLSIAYQNFQWIRQESFNKFNEALKEQTIKRTGTKGKDLYEAYDKLKFTKIAEYEKVPPQDVLTEVEKAVDLKCFDSLEVCTVESVVEYKDPIIFGVIDGCGDRFYMAQWMDDIKFEDLLKIQNAD